VPPDELQRWLEHTVLPRKAPWIAAATDSDLAAPDPVRAAGGARPYR
jgi:hypothetical protein